MVAYGVSLCQVLPGGSLSCGLFDPLGAVCGVWWPFRGFACGSPAVIEKFDPFGAAALAVTRQVADLSSVLSAVPWRMAGLSSVLSAVPWRVAGLSSVLSAARRPHYSITAGKPQAHPRNGTPGRMWAPRGSNARGGIWRELVSGAARWQLVLWFVRPPWGRVWGMVAFPRVRLRLTRGYREVRPPWGRRWMGVPFRGFASLTRGYREVRPLRGRPPL